MKILLILCILLLGESLVFGQTIKLPEGIVEKLPKVTFGGDPDEKRNACELINARGFGCEVHYVRTYQDYIIEIHRIVKNNSEPIQEHSKPIILQPGLTGSSTGFIIASDFVPTDLNVTGQNMGLELARRGYDVWLSNNRGNEYGKNHTTLDPKKRKFWEWTWDEISEFDTPAIVDYVLLTTQSRKVAYVGHSQGTAIMFALLSRTNKYDNVVEPYIALNPITRLKGATTTFRLLVAAMKPVLIFGGEAFGDNPITEGVTTVACRRPLNQICQAIFLSTVGFDNPELNSSRLAVYMSHQPTSTSARNLLHFDQMFNYGKFGHYDLGYLGNLWKYGQLRPPQYDLTNITHPSMHIIYGRNDKYVPIESVQRLEKDLRNISKEFYPVSNPRANHIDPLIGIHISPEVINKVLSILRDYE